MLNSGRMDHELLVASGDPAAKIYIAAWGPPVSKAELDAAKKSAQSTFSGRACPPFSGRNSEVGSRKSEVGRPVSKADLQRMQQTYDRWQAHGAVNYVTAEAPPTFLCVGAKDPFHPQQIQRMAEALKRCGVPYEQVVVPGLGHEVVGDVAVLERIYAFLDQHLRPAGR